MNPLLFITWTPGPEIFSIGPIHLRWYGLLFASGFLIGYYITRHIFRKEQVPEIWLDSLLLAMVLGTIIGARLGHVFFYDWPEYREHPLDILMIWKGGLASHGAAAGLFLAFWLWSQRVSKKPMLWITDRLAMSIALGGFFIRMGNLFNHEIVGKPTDVPWAFQFMLNQDDGRFVHVPRHPTQLYEAIAYICIAGLLGWLFFRTNASKKQGLLTGWFLVLVFGARILLEFTKEKQEHLEAEWINRILEVINMGQILSIPLVIFGSILIIRAVRTSSPKA
ncbi:MAG: prolipoprotein diacylglyceryl transferase [Bacteroidetes bacterium]|nr:MAG: prolipoprotein diacylglyceryl transferase [Bacteroidota bacterium]